MATVRQDDFDGIFPMRRGEIVEVHATASAWSIASGHVQSASKFGRTSWTRNTSDPARPAVAGQGDGGPGAILQRVAVDQLAEERFSGNAEHERPVARTSRHQDSAAGRDCAPLFCQSRFRGRKRGAWGECRRLGTRKMFVEKKSGFPLQRRRMGCAAACPEAAPACAWRSRPRRWPG